MIKYSIILLGLIGLHACSNEQLYNLFQDREKSLCNTVPPSEYEQCRKDATEETYKEYEEKRKEIIN